MARARSSSRSPRSFAIGRRSWPARRGSWIDCLPEYKKGGRSCLDLSCGNGVLLEVLRHYGNAVLGADRAHFDFLRSQDVPYVEFDGDRLPYPFGDRSFDLVTCIGSITFYDVPWAEVLSEFCRIARRTVFVQVQRGLDPR